MALKTQGLPVTDDALEYLASLDSNGTLLVAGTNGKGSTCAMVASALQATGYRIGSDSVQEVTQWLQLA